MKVYVDNKNKMTSYQWGYDKETKRYFVKLNFDLPSDTEVKILSLKEVKVLSLKEVEEIYNGGKISFAVEQLEKMNELLQPELRYYDYRVYLSARHKIDKQIKQLKEGN